MARTIPVSIYGKVVGTLRIDYDKLPDEVLKEMSVSWSYESSPYVKVLEMGLIPPLRNRTDQEG